MMDAREFEELSKRIAKAKEHKAQLDGRIKELMRQIKDEFGVSTLEEAEGKIKEMQQDVDELDEQLESLDAKLKEVFKW